MAETNVVNPTTGEKGSVPDEKLNRARAAGDRDMSDSEATKYLTDLRHEQSISEPFVAQSVGKVRGIGEAFGVPVDAIADSIGEAVGKGQETRDYLNDLKEYHPLASGYGEVAGQVGGGVAVSELMGLGRAPTAVGRIAAGGARGALENMVIGATHEVNETSLGNADAAGEKIWAQLPKYGGYGLIAGAGISGAGEVLGALGRVGQRSAPGMLEGAANSALGREFGGDAALGSELRTKLGGIPESRASAVDVLTKQQAGFRQAAQVESASLRDLLLNKQVSEAAGLSAKQEAGRVANAKQAQAMLGELERQHQVAREALSQQHGEAASAAVKLGKERAAARQQLRTLANDLDKVKGATLPDGRKIMAEAEAAFAPDPLTPPSPRSVEIFNEWTQTFAEKHDSGLSFKDLDEAIKSLDVLEKRQRVVSGWGNDPDTARAIQAIRSAAKSEFDAASEATASSVSEAKGLGAQRLRSTLADLEKAHDAALENVDTAQSALLDFEKKAAGEVRIAQREVSQQAKAYEKQVRIQDKDFDRGQRAEEKGLPKPSKETPVDTLLGKVRRQPPPDSLGAAPAVGALVSLLHGNVAGAVLGAMGGIAANTAKAHGNLLAARTLSGLAEHIASADGSIAKLAGRAVGRYVRQEGVREATDDKPSRKELTYEKASKQVREIQANPLILEQRVRTMAGPWAQQAPSVYQALLSAAQRQQDFLASKLPASRIDPYSLRPDLEEDDLSDTEKYDFVQYAKASADPMQAMRDVIDGDGTEQQVEAVAAVYPRIYAQAKAEVQRRVATLTKPLDYDRTVSIGTLLQVDTAEVMTGEFQSVLSDMYSSREDSEKTSGGSKPLGVNSRLSKSMASAGQQMMGGE